MIKGKTSFDVRQELISRLKRATVINGSSVSLLSFESYATANFIRFLLLLRYGIDNNNLSYFHMLVCSFSKIVSK